MTTSDETTAAFCHDHYEHPLLWCDEKKRLIERKNAEESLRMWRRRKAEEMARKEREKEEYYDLFLKHCPWGRPGGGAPNIDVRRKDITAVGLHSTPAIGAVPHRLSSLQPCRYGDYFSQRKKCHDPVVAAYHPHPHHVHTHTHGHAHGHAHAPHVPRLTTTHAHTVEHLGDDVRGGVGGSTVTICERNVGMPNAAHSIGGSGLKNGHLDIEVRYKPPKAPSKCKPLLEKIVVTEGEKCEAATQVHGHHVLPCPPKKKSSSLNNRPDKAASKDPWGKAGPGGKPWRSPKAVGTTFMKSLGWTNKEMLKDLDQDNPATPAEKPTFRKTRTTAKKPQRCCELCTCNCPAVTVGHPLKLLPSKLPPPPPSCGSPLKGHLPSKLDTIKQKLCPRFVRRCGGGGGAVETPPGAVSRAGRDHAQTNTTDNSAVTTTGGGVELVPLLARRRANTRPISLSSTDVTKRTASHDRFTTADDLRYLHDLNEQVSQKRRTISVAQQLERDLCNQHFETFDTFWGRPGHGAPSEIRTKLKLDNLLYGVKGYSD